ncbi:MAG: ferritin-like domain-containing protein [Minwuia sp.]|uniref:ferritin-like domain-containing protein n=1 Tax=Minwuia sp. TaxID=2493630 RepID=UPI003A84460A
MPKRRKAGALQNRIALLHAVAHIELNAIDLAIDIAGRFGTDGGAGFIDDWLKVADDEAQHFMLLQARLKDMGASYGDLPAHDGLWEAAETTRNDVCARLAVAHMVLEARGLDVTPAMIERFQRNGDGASAAVLKRIYTDEIGHVETGSRWFSHFAAQRNRERDDYWRELVSTHFRGKLKRPFNHEAREMAEMPPALYEPLAD